MNKLLVALAFVLSANLTFACDYCNIFINISPNDYRNSFGVYHHIRLMHGVYTPLGTVVLKHGGAEAPVYTLANRKVDEIYRTYDIRGRFYIKDKWKTMVSIPIVDNSYRIDGLDKYRVRGVGDPMIIQNYQVYNTKHCADSVSNFSQRFTVGAGVKIPLGSINKTYAYGRPNVDLQPGSGSWDFLAMAMYSIRYKKVGLITNLNVKYSTENKEGFRYGKTMNFNANLFYMKEIKGLVFMPFAGTYIEKFNKDFQNGGLLNDSGGATFFGNLGLKVYKGNFVVTAQYQKVLENQLQGDKQLFTLYRSTVGIIYNF